LFFTHSDSALALGDEVEVLASLKLIDDDLIRLDQIRIHSLHEQLNEHLFQVVSVEFMVLILAHLYPLVTELLHILSGLFRGHLLEKSIEIPVFDDYLGEDLLRHSLLDRGTDAFKELFQLVLFVLSALGL